MHGRLRTAMTGARQAMTWVERTIVGTEEEVILVGWAQDKCTESHRFIHWQSHRGVSCSPGTLQVVRHLIAVSVGLVMVSNVAPGARPRLGGGARWGQTLIMYAILNRR